MSVFLLRVHEIKFASCIVKCSLIDGYIVFCKLCRMKKVKIPENLHATI